jgi:hypothetical protein
MSRGRRCSPAVLLLIAVMLAPACSRREIPAARAFDPDSIPEAYARSTAALMWPGTTRSWQITPDGDLYDGEWVVRFVPTAGPDTAPAPRVIAFEDRWLPVAHWRRAGGDIRWDFEAAGLPDRAPRDSNLVVSLEIRATNRGAAARVARLAVRVEPPRSPIFVAFDAPDSIAAPGRITTSAGSDTAQGWCAQPEGGRASLETHGAEAVLQWTLAPGSSGVGRLVLPAYAMTGTELARWARTPHERMTADARRYWTAEVARGATFSLGDPEVESALRACEVTLLALRERRGTAWVPIGNPFQYRDVWLRDGARAIRALAVLGYTREARELCTGFEGLQWPQGAFLSQRGQLDGTGQALWAFEQALLRPARDDSVAHFAALAERAWRWVEDQRDLGRTSGWAFGAMLPYGDPRDGELVRAQLVGNDAWALAGYRSAARLLEAAGRTAEAAEVERTRARYLADFLAALERTKREDVPPSWQGGGRDWGNLAVVSPCGVLGADDPHAAALARRVWVLAGGAGLVTYGPADSAEYYVGADLGTWALLAGRPESADSVLAGMLHWRTGSGAGAEYFSRSSRDFGDNLPPHATAAAALAGLVRDALIFDDGDTLQLTLGARARWWQAGKVEHAPTCWGLLDLEFLRRGDRAEWQWSPVPVWTALALPPGTRIAGSPPRPLLRGPFARTVLAPPGTMRAQVRLEAAAP